MSGRGIPACSFSHFSRERLRRAAAHLPVIRHPAAARAEELEWIDLSTLRGFRRIQMTQVDTAISPFPTR